MAFPLFDCFTKQYLYESSLSYATSLLYMISFNFFWEMPFLQLTDLIWECKIAETPEKLKDVSRRHTILPASDLVQLKNLKRKVPARSRNMYWRRKKRKWHYFRLFSVLRNWIYANILYKLNYQAKYSIFFYLINV